tara:strand:+ start:68574 stop:69851 length:1278 start_codon:yes stop_codon:yes gene_type:complete
MIKAIALIDSNNFYTACEELIDPTLIGKPLIILSNNDGCIIARNPEARQHNIPMGEAYHRIRHKIETLNIEVRSSDYALYGDMSQRLMSLLRQHSEELDIYSIDEAFISITRPPEYNLSQWARQLRAFIYQNLGLPIAIGIGTNKVQAKLANHIAKTIDNHAGIFDLCTAEDLNMTLESIQIEKVWGIGRKLSRWCRMLGIENAKQLRDMPTGPLRKKCGVVGVRLQKELRGETSLNHFLIQPPKKETCVSKSFHRAITTKEELRQAISNHVICASEKLREQRQRAGSIRVFTRTSQYISDFYSQTATQKLAIPSNNTSVLLKIALDLTNHIYRPHTPLMKAGVIMQDLQGIDSLQLQLIESISISNLQRQEKLMTAIDKLNKRYGRNTVTWPASKMKSGWNMRREQLGHSSITRIDKIPIAKAY